MQLKLVAAFAACLSTSQVHAALTPGQAIGSLQTITTAIKSGIQTLKDISPSNAIPSVLTIIGDLRTAEDAITNAVSGASGNGGATANAKFSADVQSDICNAYHDFTLAYSQLADGVIGKNGFLSKLPPGQITAPIADILQAVNSGIEGFFGIVGDFLPQCPDKTPKNLMQLSSKVKASVSSFANKADQ